MEELILGCELAMSVGNHAPVEREKEGKDFGDTSCTGAIDKRVRRVMQFIKFKFEFFFWYFVILV